MASKWDGPAATARFGLTAGVEAEDLFAGGAAVCSRPRKKGATSAAAKRVAPRITRRTAHSLRRRASTRMRAQAIAKRSVMKVEVPVEAAKQMAARMPWTICCFRVTPQA